MVNLKTLRDLDFREKRALVRVDFNVPLKNGNVADATRILAVLPTLIRLLVAGAKIILISHLGRPRGKVDPALSLAPVRIYLEGLLGQAILWAGDCIGKEAAEISRRLLPGEILLLENLRFHPEEEKNDRDFAKALSQHGEIFVQDAFGTLHRAHASTAGLPRILPSCAGLLVEKEVSALNKLLEKPKRPFLAILGGAKVSDKLPVIFTLLSKCDILAIGGAMSYTFLKAQGIGIGDSPIEEESLGQARDILSKAKNLEKKILLPVDHAVTNEDAGEASVSSTSSLEIPAGFRGVDIGPKTQQLFSQAILSAKTIFWNGPVGIFERELSAQGTLQVARAVADATAQGAISIVGGGDSASAVRLSGIEKRVTHISTGGGASLEFLEGKILPGLASLLKF